MRKILSIILVLSLSAIYIPQRNLFSAETGEELKLFLGETRVIKVNNLSRVIIGNPAIADVSNVTSGELTITPKAVGVTTFVYTDNFGENSFKLIILSEDFNEVKRRIDNLLAKLDLPDVYAKAEEEEGKVLLLGTVKTTADKDKVLLALGPLKNKITDLINVEEEDTIIEIDAHVLEIDKGASSTLGFTWPGSINITEVGSPSLAAGGTDWGKLFRVFHETRDAFTLKIDALVQEGKARILSRPRLTCQSGKEADLMVGGEKPIFTTSVAATTGNVGTNVEYKEYGIKLKIKPTVTKDRRIKVGLNVSITELESTTPEVLGSTTAPTAKAYPFTKRTTSTELMLDDGQTMAIGGLIKQRSSEEYRKVPWMSNLPVVGMFFRQKSSTTGGGYNTKSDTELFITLTPRIIPAINGLKAKQPDAAAVPSVSEESQPAPVVSPMPLDPVTEYAAIIQKRVLENIAYPQIAKESGFQGQVTLNLELSYSGQLIKASVKKSSGYSALDDNAVLTAKRIASYPPFPPAITKEELSIDVPVLYKLN